MLRKAIVWEAKPAKSPHKKHKSANMLPPASIERPAPPSVGDLLLLTPATPWVN